MTLKASSPSAYRTRTARRLADSLRAEAERADEALYVSTELVAADVGLPEERVHALLSEMEGTVPWLRIERSSTIKPVTWRISVP